MQSAKCKLQNDPAFGHTERKRKGAAGSPQAPSSPCRAGDQHPSPEAQVQTNSTSPAQAVKLAAETRRRRELTPFGKGRYAYGATWSRSARRTYLADSSANQAWFR